MRIKRVDAVVDVREAAPLRAAVDERDRLLAQQVPEELRHDARAAFLGRVDRVEVRPDPVEGPEERELQVAVAAHGHDHAVEQLLGAGVDPAALGHRAVDQRARFLVELLVRAHAVDLGGRGEDHARLVLGALAHDAQVLLEVELEDLQRVADVAGRRRDRDQRQAHVALAHVVVDPLVVDRRCRPRGSGSACGPPTCRCGPTSRSMPCTVQSVFSRISAVRWLPMKPFTPRIRMSIFVFLSLPVRAGLRWPAASGNCSASPTLPSISTSERRSARRSPQVTYTPSARRSTRPCSLFALARRAPARRARSTTAAARLPAGEA